MDSLRIGRTASRGEFFFWGESLFAKSPEFRKEGLGISQDLPLHVQAYISLQRT